MTDHSACADLDAALGKAKTPEEWMATADWWIRELGDALPEAESLFKALVQAVKERNLAGQDADRRSCQGGWDLAQKRAIKALEAGWEAGRLRAENEALRAERHRLRALLKQAHDRDKFQGECPTIAWYDEVARYFEGKVPNDPALARASDEQGDTK